MVTDDARGVKELIGKALFLAWGQGMLTKDNNNNVVYFNNNNDARWQGVKISICQVWKILIYKMKFKSLNLLKL